MTTGADEDPRGWRDQLGPLIARVTENAGITRADLAGVGLAVPGPMSVHRGTVLAPPNMPAWRDTPVKAWVEEITGLPVTINNDANAAGLAEFRFGEFRGTPDLVFATLSTGFGAGVISGGRLVQGADDLGGEIGHLVAVPDGLPCPCGQRGCLEMYVGGRNLALRMQARLRSHPSGGEALLAAVGGDIDRLQFRDIAAARRAGDPYVGELFEEFLERLAHGLGIVAMAFNPRVIVLGTIAIHHHDLLWPALDQRLARYAWPCARENLIVRPSRLGPEIGELGAIALALPTGAMHE
jgi:glucokinase